MNVANSTGKERDTETGLDYFGARYYASNLGRYMSPDWSEVPSAVPYADFNNPQTLNLYPYVGNDPATIADADGHCFPASACADVLDQAIDRVVDNAISMSVANKSEYDAAEDTFFFSAAGDLAKGVTNLLRFGSDSGNVGDHFAQGNYLHAANDVAQDGARAVGLGVIAVGAVKGGTADGVTAERTHQTYTKTNAETGQVYSGRTSGAGTPLENIARRDSSHHMNKKGYGPAKLDKSSRNPDAIRGREQQLIDFYRRQGRSGNAINGVGKRNPNAKKYEGKAVKEFGNL